MTNTIRPKPVQSPVAAAATTVTPPRPGSAKAGETVGPASDLFAAAATTRIGSPEGPRAVVAVTTRPVAGEPLVFFNADETLSAGELGKGWTATGLTAGITPGVSPFRVAGSHNNASADSTLKVGVKVANTGTAPMKIEVSTPQVNPGKPLALPVGATATATGYRLMIPAGQSVVLPMGSAAENHAANPRSNTQPIAYQTEVRIVGPGKAADLTVSEVACHPSSKATQTPAYQNDKLHHEGLFLPQVQAGPVTTLSRDNAVALKTAGSQSTHDSHYLTPHQFQVGIPGPASQTTVTFRNASGGLLNTTVNGKPLTLAASAEKPVTTLTMSVDEAVRKGLLEPTGGKDSSGNPVYAMTVTWLSGSNCDLSLYSTPPKK